MFSICKWRGSLEDEFVCVYENKISNDVWNSWGYYLIINNIIYFVLCYCVYVDVSGSKIDDCIDNWVSGRYRLF